MMQPRKLGKPSVKPLDKELAYCLFELLDAVSSFHRLHLKVQGAGSYAQHRALQDLYEGLPTAIDAVIEGYQGASETLLISEGSTTPSFNTVEDALKYLRTKAASITSLQSKVPYSEVVNNMDLIKDLINSAKYKLVFLK